MPIPSAAVRASRLARYGLRDIRYGARVRTVHAARPARPASRSASRMLLAAVAVARLVDIGVGDAADIGIGCRGSCPKWPSSSHQDATSTAPFMLGSRIDDAGGLERIDHAERPIEPARVVLAFEMRPRQQLRPGLRAGAEDVADAVDLAREAGLGKALHQPLPGNADAVPKTSACERRSCRRRWHAAR